VKSVLDVDPLALEDCDVNSNGDRWMLCWLIARYLALPLEAVLLWRLTIYELWILEAEARLAGPMFEYQLGSCS